MTNSVSVWAGYVDALSALIMVVIFVLLIFMMAHFLLSGILSGQENELAILNRRINDLAELLGLEKQQNEALKTEMTDLSGMISNLTNENEALSAQVLEYTEQSKVDRLKIKNQLLVVSSLQEDIVALRRVRRELEQQVGVLASALKKTKIMAGAMRDRSKSLEARLADEEERTLLAQKEVEKRDIRIQALVALVGEQKEALEKERELSADVSAEVALLNQQIRNLRRQLEEISHALEVAETEKKAKEVKIKELGKRLNIVLARRVHKLERYRSEFFGRLREFLGDNPRLRIEGDRFILQAELLFDSGSEKLGGDGKQHLLTLAATLRQLSKKIPEDIDWILRIDGHTDRIPIRNEHFASNWELSIARALSVVKFLGDNGIPQYRMAATGFSKFHPIDPADTPEAYQKNRRIEIKLTSR
jgi:chemotaxis protein MotB